MLLILLLLAVYPVRSRVLQEYVEIENTGDESQPKPFGSQTASALRDFSAMMLPKKSPGDVARSMMDKVDLIGDMIGPSFDRPVGEMISDLMNSTPDDIMHGLIDPIMSSPISKATTMGELDAMLAQIIRSKMGEVPSDADDVLGTQTIYTALDYASEILPQITAFQFAGQIMLQLQVQFAPVMTAMKNNTVIELVEPIMKAMKIIPDVTPSEAAHMLAEPIMKNMDQVALGTVDRTIAEFIRQLQGNPRILNDSDQDLRSGNPSQNLEIQRMESPDFAHQEQIDQLRFSEAPQNTETYTNFNEQAENKVGNENLNTPFKVAFPVGPLIDGFNQDKRFDGRFLDQALSQVSGDSNIHSQNEFGTAENQKKIYDYSTPKGGLKLNRG